MMGGPFRMNRDEFCSSYWNYYKSIEQDFMKTTRFVEFELGDNNLYDISIVPIDKANSEVYSTEYLRLYLAACSEVDVICKSICAEYGDNNADNIRRYTNIILDQPLFQDIASRKLLVIRDNKTTLQPFLNWVSGSNYQSPHWWKFYNEVKHNRISNYKNANLKNLINAIGGLYLLEIYLLRKITFGNVSITNLDIPDDPSELFQIKDWNTKFISQGSILYELE